MTQIWQVVGVKMAWP